MAQLSDEDVLAAFPHAIVDRDNVAFFRGMLEKKLMVNRCNECGLWNQPPWPVCPNCWSTDVTAQQVSGNGTVHTLITLHHGVPYPGVDYVAGYPVAVVELDEQPGLRASATIVNCDPADLRIGLKVSLTWLERGGEPLPAFQPATAPSSTTQES